MTSAQMEAVLSAYKTLAKIPSVVNGRLNKAGTRADVLWSTRNLDKGRSVKYRYNYIFDKELQVIGESDYGIDTSTELLSSISPTERFRAVIREDKEKDKKKQYLEVWERHQLAHSIDLTAVDLHGDVYTEFEFASLEWSPDEQSLVYVAEAKPPPAEPYVKRRAAKGEADDKEKLVGAEYELRADWGEQLASRRRAACVLASLPGETLRTLGPLPDDVCPGQLVFSADGGSVFGVAYDTRPERLGLVYCSNRRSHVFRLTLDGEHTRLSAPGLAVSSPRPAPGGLLWMQREAGGPHHACLQLARYDFDTQAVTVVVDVPAAPRAVAGGLLGGLSAPPPRRCVSGDRAVLHAARAADTRPYVVHLPTGAITELPVGCDSDPTSECGFRGSLSVLDVSGDLLLGARSSLTQPPELVVARLPPAGSELSLSWRRLSSAAAPPGLRGASVEHLTHTHKDCAADDVASFASIRAGPAAGAGAALVAWPHGGPHSAFTDSWSLEAALYLLSGFSLVLINYRGSLGAGERALRSLPGRVGDADVKDCLLAIDDVLDRYPLPPSRVCVAGGSHGGFLAAHLTGRRPAAFAAAALRNPVIDVASMFSVSDIPDWCSVECGLPYTQQGPASEEHLLSMRRSSPLAHVHRVTAPTALMLGSADRRVPASQGLEYARRLRANGVETKVYMYDDNHALSSLPNEIDHVINTMRWFLTHIGKE